MDYMVTGFDDEFKKEVIKCQEDELNFKLLHEQYKEALHKVRNENETRYKIFLQYRNNKLDEIKNEILRSRTILSELERDKEEILGVYCKKNGHNYITLHCNYKGLTGWHTFMGDEQIYDISKKCSVCGHRISDENYKTPYAQYETYNPYVQEIPEEIYDNENYSKNNMTVKMIDEEIKYAQEYINYLNSLKKRLCEIFGHEVEDEFGGFDFCSCCEEVISKEKLRNSRKRCSINLFREKYAFNKDPVDYLINYEPEQNSPITLSLDFPKFK